jgi:hypothetical protein
MTAKTQEQDRTATPHIGTLNERSLHSSLKAWYAEDGDLLEVPVDGFVADIVRGDLLIEIQTSSTSGLRRKLRTLLRRHPVRLVLPVTAKKTILRAGSPSAPPARRSPRRGGWADAFSELVGLRELLGDPNLSVDLVLIDEEEVRTPTARRRRRDWAVQDRRLIRVIDCVTLQEPMDYLAFVPSNLPEPFTTLHLSAALGQPRRTAQKIAYTLRHLGALRIVGKERNAFLYRRSVHDAPPDESPDGSERVSSTP